MIGVSLYMVYCSPHTGLTTVKWRKHVYWLLRSVFKPIFVSYMDD